MTERRGKQIWTLEQSQHFLQVELLRGAGAGVGVPTAEADNDDDDDLETMFSKIGL
jgi:hypothetical protein